MVGHNTILSLIIIKVESPTGRREPCTYSAYHSSSMQFFSPIPVEKSLPEATEVFQLAPHLVRSEEDDVLAFPAPPLLGGRKSASTSPRFTISNRTRDAAESHSGSEGGNSILFFHRRARPSVPPVVFCSPGVGCSWQDLTQGDRALLRVRGGGSERQDDDDDDDDARDPLGARRLCRRSARPIKLQLFQLQYVQLIIKPRALSLLLTTHE